MSANIISAGNAQSDAGAGGRLRPNILFIFADDWGWGDLSCHGHPYVKTPNIDRLAREGTDFSKFTVANGVCSPSRTAVMTGHFPARYNINGHFAWVQDNQRRNMPDWLDPAAPLLPRFLRKGGYATAHYGKWHLSNNMIPDSPLPLEYGYDEYGAFNCAGEQMPPHEDARLAIDFIRKSHRKGKPFFINLWMHETHTPFHTLPKYRWRFPELKEADNIYASVISHADERIGKVLDALDELEIADNTLVVFSSDNGPARARTPTRPKLHHDTATGVGYGIGASKGKTGGRKGYKGCLFQGGIGVPFIARWPGRIKAGRVDDKSMISAVDLLPTFCRIAGVELPSDYKPDGVSKVDALLGKNISPVRTKPLFWKMDAPWPPPSARSNHWAAYAAVSDKWKLLSNRDGSYCELYNIGKDIYEQNDLKERYPEIVAGLKRKIGAWRKGLPAKADPKCFSRFRGEPRLTEMETIGGARSRDEIVE